MLNFKDGGPKINILKGNHCILRIRGVPVRQKLKLEKNVFYKKWSPKLIFLKMIFFEKIPSIFDIEIDFESMISAIFEEP